MFCKEDDDGRDAHDDNLSDIKEDLVDESEANVRPASTGDKSDGDDKAGKCFSFQNYILFLRV